MIFLDASKKYSLSGSRIEGIVWLGESPRQNLIMAWDTNRHLSLALLNISEAFATPSSQPDQSCLMAEEVQPQGRARYFQL